MVPSWSISATVASRVISEGPERMARAIFTAFSKSSSERGDAVCCGSAIAAWQANTESVPGIVGAMYTTWEDKYGAMDKWAAAAWDGKFQNPNPKSQ